jgi:hypothetical protein
MSMSTFTIEQLESLATQLETTEVEQHARLERLCRAYARIIRAASPDRFTRRATHYGDEAGSWDSSYPPDMEYSAHTGPLSIVVCNEETDDTATSRGFYHSWRRVTVRGALAIGTDGTWYRSDEHGTGHFGPFAAHPGRHDVDVEIEWSETSDVSTAELAAAEAKLRALAFPLVAARIGGAS